MKLKRITAALLLLAMLLSCLPLTALAVETGTPDVSDVPTPEITVVENTDSLAEPVTLAAEADTGGENYFYLSAQTTRTSQQLLIRPTKVYYDADDSIAQALLNSGYSFTDLNPQYSKFITKIQNVEGNFTFCGDFPTESVTLLEQASSIHYLYFSEETKAQMTPVLKSLMQVAADYLDKPADVQAAAKAAYDEVLAQYPGQTEEETAALAEKLSSAIQSYEDSLTKDLHNVSVTTSDENCVITALNEYGREFAASGNTLRLPEGTYTIEARAENRVASRKNVAVPGTDSVSLTLPSGNWFNEAGFQISRTYESLDTENGSRFKDGLCATDAENQTGAHTVVAQIPDAYAGELYPYVPKTADAPAKLALTVSYRKTDGSMVTDQAFTAGSYTSSLADAVRLGTEGNEAIFCLSREAEGCTQHMELKLVLARVPTLKSLRVENADGVVQAADHLFSSLEKSYTYKIVTTDHVTLRMEATTAGSTITVTSGDETFSLGADGSVSVPVSGNTDIVVTVSSGKYAMAYTVKILPSAGKSVKFTMVDADALEVRNKNDEVLGCTSEKDRDGTVIYYYTLVPGEEYSYVATKSTYYHTKKTFIADADPNTESNYKVKVNAGDWMSGLWLGNRSETAGKGSIPFTEKTFNAMRHSYTAQIPDSTNAVYAWFTSDDVYKCKVLYPCQSSAKAETPGCEAELSSGGYTGVPLSEALLSGSAYGNRLTFRLSQKDTVNDVTDYVDYFVTLKRTLSLRDMTATLSGSNVLLYRSDSTTTGYLDTETAYSVLIPAAAGSLDLTFQTQQSAPKYGDADNGYVIYANKRLVPESGQISVPLRGGTKEETIRVVLTNRYVPDAKTEYTIRVRKAPTTAVHFDVKPSDALVYIYEKDSGNRVWPEDNTFALSEGFTYQCTVTKAGYVGQSGELKLINGVLTFDGKEYTDLEQISVELEPAAKDSLTHELKAEWPDFRGNSSNNAVTDAPSPIYATDGTLYWAVQLGEGYSSGAVSNPILVNGELVVYAKDKIYRIDKDTGATIKTGTMAGTSDFAINGPTYADGMLLVGLSNGRVQAFDAVTLESLWIYTDPLRGQSNCPITVSNGYAYTGFWNSETRDGSFVCLSLTDEDPSLTDEAKYASWRHVQNGGFYWAGAYVCDDFVMVGTDDGEAGCSYLYLLDPATGAELDSKSDLDGDIRSTIAYDKTTDAYYFTSKGGSFYRVTVKKENGSPVISTCEALKLNNGVNGPETPPMSTSTPVVYKGRSYIGVSGTGQFTPYSGHNITVIDLTGEMSIAYSVPTQGYPQTSGLLTTAYEKATGYVYVYFFDNYIPGTLRVLRDSAGQKKPEYLTRESYKGLAYDTPHALFTPVKPEAQYAICSPIVDENGTIYFKNDSAHLMAFGSALKSMTVTKDPDKTEYEVGETFEPEGLKVTGTFVNGVTRDVTKMLSFPTTAIREDDTFVSVAFGEDLRMYHNEPAASNKMTPGKETHYAAREVPITVKVRAISDKIGGLDWTYAPQSGELSVRGDFNGRSLIAACYDANGRMTQVQTLDKAGDLKLNNSAKIKLFLLDSTSKPVCPAVTVKNSTT